MATTRMTATNTFSKGLIMDFNPMVTKTDCLVNALNATLLTYNGNELQLQQDMGNGRVETAYLPEGYVPVGSCEFGDIIYIVSYNPLENKSQIGCFPSPERNITSDEITDMQQNLTNTDFQKMDGNTPTGVLNATSVKKIIYGNKNMNPGDKYIIYDESTGNTGLLSDDGETLSDYGNTAHTHGTWPKLVKISVVSIEDSGKIVDLNASVKWYDNDYYIAHLSTNPTGASVDIDSYRSLVSSAYAVFQSKVSGKLAILAELEAIDEFSCTYDVYTEKYNEDDPQSTVSKGYTRYKIYFYTAWGNEHNDVNPSGFLFTKSEWTKDSGGGQIWVPTLQENGDYMYKPGESTEDIPSVPVKAASTIDENTKLVTNYDAKAVYGYTRLYDLGDPTASDYQDFIENKSYNAQIEAIIDWKEEEGTHTAIADEANYQNLRQVTQVTRILNQDTGEPVGSDSGEFQYVYNLDIYSYDSERGQYIYQTKGLNGDPIELAQIVLTDDVINNYFHKDIPTLITSRTIEDVYDLKTSTFIEVPVDETKETITAEVSNDLSHLIWNYEIAPVMPYGVLDWLAISGNIDFSKLGTGLIDLVTWRYYNSGNVSTLTWGLEAYPEPNKGITEVVFDFYDNQGLAASYHITDKTSYSGTFTENIVLGQRNSSYKMNNIDAYGHVYYHAGAIDDNDTENEDAIYLTKRNKPTKDPSADLYSSDKYFDDSGTLYPNVLYLARITVKYCPKDIIGNYNTDNQTNFKTFYRWYWTNGLLNESYYNVQDFDVLQPSLSLDFSASFDTRGNDSINQLVPKQYDYYNNSYETEESSVLLYSTLGARIYAINQDSSDDAAGNIKMLVEPGLAEGFNTFNLNEAVLASVGPVYIRIGHSSITKSTDTPSLIHSGDDIITDCDDNLQPIGDFNESLQCSHESNGWDRTGYASYNYGVYQNIVSDNLLSILDTERATYNGIDPVGQATGSADTDLYDSKEAYTAYTDSFCLNIVGGSLERKGEGNDFSYYDSAGNLINDLEHWQEITCELKTIRDQGIPLTLTGITFSKIFAAESTPDSNSVTLKSMIHNLENTAANGPDIVGLHFYNEHLYFNEMVMWAMGEPGGKKTRVRTVYSRNITGNEWIVDPNNSEDVDYITTYSNKHGEWRPDFTHEEVQEILSAALSQPISAFMIGGHRNDNFNYVNSNMDWDYIHSEFGLTDAVKGNKRIYQNKDKVPDDDMSVFMGQNAAWGIHSFVVRDVAQNLVIPFADYFVSGNGTTNKQYSSYRNNTPYSLGDMLGSIFAQIYVVTDENTDSYLLENITYLQDYTEYWNTDIVVKIDTDNLDNSIISNLITVQAQPLNTYLTCLFENAPCDGDPEEALQFDIVNLNNVTFNLYGIQRTIAFQYSVPYNLGNLVYSYNQLSTSSNKIYLTTSTKDPENYNGSQEVQSFTGNVTANTLYTWTGSTVVQFGQGSTIYLADKFINKDNELCLTYKKDSSNLVSSAGLGDLAKILHYDSNAIDWRNLSQCSYYDYTYDIMYQTDDDDPYLKGLPRITIFRKYNPGK